ncbi:MAG TPA: FAD-dependent oxidoreductase [Thermoanaerobaculia bacterium]|nr:FAD-dependent oxidoreductase [Thermoanaerobaculia bacterium]
MSGPSVPRQEGARRERAPNRPANPLTILGGGPAGLGVAFYARRAGLPFVLLEASSALGGLCRTLRCGDHLYDCGAHRYHDRDPEITRDLVALLGGELERVDAPSAIRDRGRYIDFPPTPLNSVFAYGLRDAVRIGWDLLRSGARRRRSASSFEDLAVGRFGETLARRILLNYSAKLWGMPADQLSPDVATRRLQGMTLRSLIHELVVPAKKVEHVDGSFLYPRGGYGRIVEALVETLPPEALRTGSEVVALEVADGVVRRVRCADGRDVEEPERVVSTLPLTRLVRLLGDAVPESAQAAARRLRFRHVRLLFLRLATPSLSRYASIYVPDPAFCISRLCEPRNRSAAMAPAGETSILVEVPCFPGDALETLSDEALAARVVEELRELRLVNPSDILEWRHHGLPNAYPVYAMGYASDVGTILAALSPIENLETLGRAGRFHYSHLHDQLRFGKDSVARLVDAGRRAVPGKAPSPPGTPAAARRGARDVVVS